MAINRTTKRRQPLLCNLAVQIAQVDKAEVKERLPCNRKICHFFVSAPVRCEDTESKQKQRCLPEINSHGCVCLPTLARKKLPLISLLRLLSTAVFLTSTQVLFFSLPCLLIGKQARQCQVMAGNNNNNNITNEF